MEDFQARWLQLEQKPRIPRQKVTKETDATDIVFVVYCRKRRAKLLYKYFYCPGTNNKCIDYFGNMLTPREFSICGEPNSNNDWKTAMSIDGVPIGQLTEDGQIDYYNHQQRCDKQCQKMLPGNLNDFFSEGLIQRWKDENTVRRLWEDCPSQFWHDVTARGFFPTIMGMFEGKIEDLCLSPGQLENSSLLNRLVAELGLEQKIEDLIREDETVARMLGVSQRYSELIDRDSLLPAATVRQEKKENETAEAVADQSEFTKGSDHSEEPQLVKIKRSRRKKKKLLEADDCSEEIIVVEQVENTHSQEPQLAESAIPRSYILNLLATWRIRQTVRKEEPVDSETEEGAGKTTPAGRELDDDSHSEEPQLAGSLKTKISRDFDAFGPVKIWWPKMDAVEAAARRDIRKNRKSHSNHNKMSHDCASLSPTATVRQLEENETVEAVAEPSQSAKEKSHSQAPQSPGVKLTPIPRRMTLLEAGNWSDAAEEFYPASQLETSHSQKPQLIVEAEKSRTTAGSSHSQEPQSRKTPELTKIPTSYVEHLLSTRPPKKPSKRKATEDVALNPSYKEPGYIWHTSPDRTTFSTALEELNKRDSHHSQEPQPARTPVFPFLSAAATVRQPDVAVQSAPSEMLPPQLPVTAGEQPMFLVYPDEFNQIFVPQLMSHRPVTRLGDNYSQQPQLAGISESYDLEFLRYDTTVRQPQPVAVKTVADDEIAVMYSGPASRPSTAKNFEDPDITILATVRQSKKEVVEVVMDQLQPLTPPVGAGGGMAESQLTASLEAVFNELFEPQPAESLSFAPGASQQDATNFSRSLEEFNEFFMQPIGGLPDGWAQMFDDMDGPPLLEAATLPSVAYSQNLEPPMTITPVVPRAVAPPPPPPLPAPPVKRKLGLIEELEQIVKIRGGPKKINMEEEALPVKRPKLLASGPPKYGECCLTVKRGRPKRKAPLVWIE